MELFLPVRQYLKAGDHGLDFGSGPNPVLAQMFREEGFDMQIFDPFYSCNPEPLSGVYDFITASEVFEHLRDPLYELERLCRILKPGGILCIMTGMLPGPGAEEFREWFYKNDKTHLCFFSPAVFRWIAGIFNLKMEWASGNVVILRKRVYGQIISGNPCSWIS
jgi:SAM-dependent methyltransferase